MTRVDPTQNMARFYEIDIQPGLFGDISVTRHWGRIGAAGQSTRNWFQDEGTAASSAEKIRDQKVRRGYTSRPALPASRAS